jgi:hypothetical protein
MMGEVAQIRVADSIVAFAKEKASGRFVINKRLERCQKLSDVHFRVLVLKGIQDSTVQWNGCEPDGVFCSTLVIFCRELLSRVDEIRKMLTVSFEKKELRSALMIIKGILDPLDIPGHRDPSRKTLVVDLKVLMHTIGGGA